MAQKIIEVADLKKYYNGGAVHAMDGVTVDICRGDVIAVIGPSGGGKSTFLRSLNLLEKWLKEEAYAVEGGKEYHVLLRKSNGTLGYLTIFAEQLTILK